MLLLLCVPAFAQNRPLQTPDAETVPTGTLRAEAGFDFLQDVNFPASGLSGDLTSLGNVEMRMGVGRIVEVDLEGVIQNFLDVKKQSPSMIPLHLTGTDSTHDVGDFALYTKILLVSEQKHRPAFAFRFGFQMPNSNQARGIGLNTTNVFASFIAQKHFGKLNTWGEAGLGILQSPLANFSQNDVLIYGVAMAYPVSQRITLVGEISGRYNDRKVDAALLGTESRSQARFGVQVFAGGFQWDVAGVAGLTRRDPSTGFTLGVSRDIKLFTLSPKP
ncbi:MAG TPA: transporter [Candidatus Acidoferrales bacterium]|nr:transporter [Candidatus Acidoferrales bacterium]